MEGRTIGTLIINYDKLTKLESEGKKVVRYKEEYLYDLQSNNMNALRGITGEYSSYISESESYIRKKIEELTEDAEHMNDFIRQIYELVELAYEMDREVAALYTLNTAAYPRNISKVGTNFGFSEFVQLVIKGYNLYNYLCFKLCGKEDLYLDLKVKLRYWYECKGGRELLKIAGHVVLYSLAVVGLAAAISCASPFIAICGTIAATIGVANSIIGLSNATKAYNYAKNENPAMARVVGARVTLADELRAYNFGNSKANKNSYGIATGLEVTEITLSLVCFAHDIKLIQKVKTASSAIGNYAKSLSKEKMVTSIKSIPGKATNLCSSIQTYYKNGNRLSKDLGSKGIILAKNAKNKIITYGDEFTKSVSNMVEEASKTGKRYKAILNDVLEQTRNTILPKQNPAMAGYPGLGLLDFGEEVTSTTKQASKVSSLGKVDDLVDASKVSKVVDDIDVIDVPSVGDVKVIEGGSKTLGVDELVTRDSKFLDSNGDIDWERWAPNNGRVPGTIKEGQTLDVGTVIDRYGNQYGKYTSPVGVPYEQRALPYLETPNAYHQYEVIKPIDNVTQSEIAKAFEQPGGGIQYELPSSIKQLIKDEFIKEIK